MNRWVYNIGFLFLGMSMLFFSACSDEVVITGPEIDSGSGGGDKEIPLMISFKDLARASTYAAGTTYPGDSILGSTWEDAINDVRVFIFNQSFECEKIIDATTSTTNPVMVKTGIKNIVAVVNAAGKFDLDPLPAVGAEATVNYSELLKKLTTVSTSMPTSPFLMAGKKLNVSLPDELPSASPYHEIIDVERAVAKVKLRVVKGGDAVSHNITLTNVYLSQGANRVALLEAPLGVDPAIGYDLDTATTRFRNSTALQGVFSGVVPGESSGEYCEMVDSFYVYESLCGPDKDRGVKIVLESTVNGGSTPRTAEFYLGEYFPTLIDTLYDIKRNHWYDITVRIMKPGMDSVHITVNASPWNLTDTIKKEEGEGYEAITASPFKLVKNYVESEYLTNPLVAAINEHSKGASWIDLKVTPGTKWDLSFASATGRNQGAKMWKTGETTWSPGLSGQAPSTGDSVRVYIYRPYVENSEPELGPEVSLKLGDALTLVRNFVVQPRDMTPFPTNSYILRPQRTGTPTNETRAYIPLAGVYSYWENYLLANGDTIPHGNITVESVGTPDAGAIKSISVINPTKRDSAYILAEAGPTPGNAVIAMRVGGTDIYWSFHLWVTEYNPNEPAGQVQIGGKAFMDRNLGALSNSGSDATGFYYQFGRKDPFRGSPATAAMPTALVPPLLRPLTAIPAAIKAPGTFYTGATAWSLQTEDKNLWSTANGNKTAFDPCPEGWRVPVQTGTVPPVTNNPWNGITPANSGYYPHHGSIGTGGGAPSGDTYFWSSWSGSDDIMSSALSYTGSVFSNTSINKSRGAHVRCVKE